MSWTNATFIICVLMVLLKAQSSVAGPVAYPVNPLVTKQAIYISSDGVTCLDKATLKLKWQSIKGLQTYEPILAGHLVLAGSNQGVFALGRDNGEIAWRLNTGAILYSPSIDQNIAYISGVDGSLQAAVVKTGQILWTKKFEGWIYPPAITGNILVTGGQHAIVWGIDKKSGEIIWEKDLSGEELVYRPIALPARRILLTTFGARTIAIFAKNGSTAWELTTETAVSNPVVFGSQLFLNGFDGSIRSLDLRRGTVMWKQSLNGSLPFTATVHNGMILTGDDEGVVTFMDFKTGEILNQFINHQEMIASPFIIGSSVVFPVIDRQRQLRLRAINTIE